MIDLHIPTLGRVGKQTTLVNLPKKWRRRCILVVQKADYQSNQAEYDELCEWHGCRLRLLPDHITTISPTRQYLIDTCDRSIIVMMDDDLVFSARRSDNPTKFRSMTEDDYDAMFNRLSDSLYTYAHVGVSHREGANRNTDEYVYNSRQMRVLGYNLPKVDRHGIVFGRIPVMEDFDVCLQLLRAGEPNCLDNMFVHNQGGSDTSGGCSTFRTRALQAEAAHALHELHPDFVKVVQKETKTSWGGEVRTDVRISWKKSYGAG